MLQFWSVDNLNRYEYYKKMRVYRRNILLTFVLFLFLLIAGISISCSTTGSMLGRNSLKFFSVTRMGENIYSFEIIGMTGAVNMNTVREDAGRVKAVFENKIQSLLSSE